ncbi:unnamed protein product [Lactuca virosa]|uniref:DNA-directed RNA polymerase n=1 Tax=Lactuca virosa TaxID=75947 RepID=A0AAU9PD00_9ASTR|nr:unnamed protein product [Lactuca virosa]
MVSIRHFIDQLPYKIVFEKLTQDINHVIIGFCCVFEPVFNFNPFEELNSIARIQSLLERREQRGFDGFIQYNIVLRICHFSIIFTSSSIMVKSKRETEHGSMFPTEAVYLRVVDWIRVSWIWL